MTQLVGIILLILGIITIRAGLKWEQAGDNLGKYITNIRTVGAGILILIGAISFLFTDKSLCEILGIFC
jgi:hypothetical protein